MRAEPEGPQLSCDLPIELPGVIVHNELLLSGWAVSPRGTAGVVVDLGERSLNASFGLDTPELPARMPGMPRADSAGYLLRVDTSGWEAGPLQVKITAYDQDEESTAIEGEVTILPFEPAASGVEENRARIEAGGLSLALDAPLLDGPRELTGQVEVLGWAYADRGVETVVVTVDGRLQHDALRPIARPDLLADYGPQVALDAGFVSRLQGEECAPGRHTLSVVALAADGKAVGVEGQIVCRAEPAREGPAAIAPRDDLPEPRRRDRQRDLERPETGWEDRALLAEADAAESRAAARIAYRSQRSFAGAWRELDEKLRRFGALEEELAERDAELERVRREEPEEAEEAKEAEAELDRRDAELEQVRGHLLGAEEALERARADLEATREDLAVRDAELEEARGYLRGAEELLEQSRAELEQVRRSAAWRLTRPLRALGRLFPRRADKV